MREHRLCPCAPCEIGANLLGVVQPDGRLAYLPPGIGVDAELSRAVRQNRPAEVAFRYSSRCVESRCQHWRDQRCTALDEVRSHLSGFARTAELPACGIRSQCRWHAQAGDSACAVCPLVSSDLMALAEIPEIPELDLVPELEPAELVAV
jgi:hypothetical protein